MYIMRVRSVCHFQPLHIKDSLGIVYDMTQSYDASFFFAGSLILLSGIVSCVIPFAHRYERSKMKNEGTFASDEFVKQPLCCRRLPLTEGH